MVAGLPGFMQERDHLDENQWFAGIILNILENMEQGGKIVGNGAGLGWLIAGQVVNFWSISDQSQAVAQGCSGNAENFCRL